MKKETKERMISFIIISTVSLSLYWTFFYFYSKNIENMEYYCDNLRK